MTMASRLAMTTAEVTSEPKRSDFEAIFQANFRFVCASLQRLGVRERDVEDVAQELFVVVHRKLDSYDDQRPVHLWLFGFCLRAASDYRRLARNRRLVHTDVEPAHPDLLADDKIAAEQNRRLLLAALDELDSDRREVFVMHDLNEFSSPQIAEMLSIPVNTVYSRLRMAREELKRAVTRLRASRGSK